MGNNPNPYSSEKKKNVLLDKFQKANFPIDKKNQPSQVNFATADEIQNAKFGTKGNFNEMMSEKPSGYQSKLHIPIGNADSISLVCLSNINEFDRSNPGRMEEVKKSIETAKQLATIPGRKVFICFLGNLFGKQWKMSELTNAKITADGHIQYFGLDIREKSLLTYLQKSLDVADIILMKGSQEFLIEKLLNGKNPIQECIDKLNQKPQNNGIYFADEGVNLTIDFYRQNKNKTEDHFPIQFCTNSQTSAQTAKGAFNASIKKNGETMPDMLTVISNSSMFGQLDENKISVTNISQFSHAPTGANPVEGSNQNNIITCTLEKINNKIQLSNIKGGCEFLYEDNSADKLLHEQRTRNLIAYDLTKEQLEKEKFKADQNIIKGKV